ncbi:MAG TPA: FtsX-like permease family protein [Gammaproteobacteria bacterium]
MEIRPILSAMLRNKTGPVLIALQIAITLAIVANAAFIIEQRAEKMNRPTGMDHENLIFARSYGFAADHDTMATIREDIDALNAMPGVRSAAYITNIPLSGSGSNSGFLPHPPEGENDPDSTNANYYSGDHRLMETLGLKLAAGRWFNPEEIEYNPDDKAFGALPSSVVVTRAWADAAFGEGEPVVGKLLYDSIGDSTRIIGVIEHMQGAWVSWDQLDQVIIMGNISAAHPVITYAINVEPGQKDRLVAEIEAKLQDINRDRVVIEVRTHTDYIAESYSNDSAMIQMLTGVSVLLVAVTALGIVGLAAFNVNQRKKQIGTRRALGARRIDILRYFLVESLAITGIGIVIGTLLAFGMSWWLGTQFNLPQLDWRFVPPVILGVLVISQLAVLGPARRASGISPALATRSV